jgi:glycosyltransferase involved in cell wall biosynthesis
MDGRTSAVNEPKIIVAQLGARHNYAVPRMLCDRRALTALYTDLCFHGLTAGIAGVAAPWVGRQLAGKLRRRTVQGIPAGLIRSASSVNIVGGIKGAAMPEAGFKRRNSLFSRRMMQWGVGDANVVYAMWGSGSAFWRHAKEKGLKVAIDVFITPVFHLIVAEERRAFPDWCADWEAQSPVLEALQHELIEAHVAEIFEIADLLVCPSQTVVEGIFAFSRRATPPISIVPRTIIIPYASTRGRNGDAEAHRGRILFVGGSDLRKGFHYFAKASVLLAAKGYEFRIAGVASERVRKHPQAQHLKFLGHLPQELLAEEYRRADVLVLPTLAEGSAGVVLEALAAGIPVVTTRSAGSLVSNGREGLIVPERNVEALAQAIETIVEDREMRAEMSKAALMTASRYDERRWGDRLYGTLKELVNRETRLDLAAIRQVG